MKILLINPSSLRDRRAGPYSSLMFPVAPLGVGYLAAVAINAGHEVWVEDQYASGIEPIAIAEFAKKQNADLIGISCLSPTMPYVEQIIDQIRRRLPNAHITLGGMHATYFAADLLEKLAIDSIVLGEGEATFADLLSKIPEGKDISGIAGLASKGPKGSIFGPDRPPIDTLDDLPFPAWDRFRIDDYMCPPRFMMQEPMLPIQTARGCPFQCSYCSQNMFYNSVRRRRIPLVVDEIEWLGKEHGISAFGMADAIFPLGEKSGLEFCEELARRGLDRKVRWFTETRYDAMTPKLLSALKRSGCTFVMYGFESASERLLTEAGKKPDIEKALLTMQNTKKAGLGSYGLFMIGFPGETLKEARSTIRFAKKLDCDVVSFARVTPYPGSRLYEEFKETFPKDVPPWQWNNQFRPLQGEARWLLPGLSHDQITSLIREAMLSYYLRPSIIVRHLRKKTFSARELTAAFFSLTRDVFSWIKGRLLKSS